MIEGTVTNEREIIIMLEVLAKGSPPRSVQTVVDTGFTGYLTLPLHVVDSLNARSAGTRRAELGDGSIVELGVFFVSLLWHGEEREVLVLQAETEPLIGMSLLWGSRVEFNAQENGKVSIEPVQ